MVFSYVRNSILGELVHRGFLAFYRLDLLQVGDCKAGCLCRRLWTCILWGKVVGSVIGKTDSDGGVGSNQLIGGT